MTEENKTTRDRVVELLNVSSFLQSDKEKIANLAKVQELIIHHEPQLLDSFFEEVATFQTDRNSDVRKFVVGFIEEACKKDAAMLPRLVPNIQLLLNDEAVVVVKRVVQAAAQIHRAALAWLASARTTTVEMEQVWAIMTIVKTTIITLIDHDNDGVRTQAIKFLEALVLLQTYTEPDSITREGEFNLDQVPLTLKVARPRKLEEEAKLVLKKLMDFQGSIHISSVNLMTCMSSLTIIARARPQFLGKIVNALEILHANLPPTLTKSQVNSVRKHLKIQLLNLLKHPASYDYHENISTVLNDLGITASEMNRSMPSKESIKKRVRRDKLGEEGSSAGEQQQPASKKPRIEKEEKKIGNKTEESIINDPVPLLQPAPEKKSTALDITQRWLVDKLTSEIVASLVMVTMLNLPEEMPAVFSACYAPITAAGTKTQIKHVARLLGSQLTAAGVGPGAEQQAQQEQITSGPGSDEEDIVQPPQDMQVSGAALVPAGVVARGFRHSKVKAMKLGEVTRPLPPANMKHMHSVLLTRLLRSSAAAVSPKDAQNHIRILAMLTSSVSNQECRELVDFILEDMSNRGELLISWLYSKYATGHDFSQVGRFVLSAEVDTVEEEEKGTPGRMEYSDILWDVVDRLVKKEPSKERDELLWRLMMEAPQVPGGLVRELINVGDQGIEAVVAVAQTLTDLARWRPTSSTSAVQTLAFLATHDQEKVREKVMPIVEELCENDETKLAIVVESSRHYLSYLLESSLPVALCSPHLGRPFHPGEEWTDHTVKACLYLCLALLPLNQALIHNLAQVYVKTVNEAKRAILRLLEGPIRHMGMDSPELLKLVETCPKGGETLITRIIHILTEKAPPSEALVCRVRELYNRRVSDVRFLIPVLTGLSKKEVIAVLPKLIKLNPHVVKEVFNRLWGVTLDTGASPLTPVDLLVALHLIDNEKCDVKTVIKATGLCFAERNIYTAEVLAFVLQQLMEQPELPTLFMRTVIQTLTHHPKLLGFIINVLHRLIAKQVWKQRKVWEGFIKCCQRAVPQSFTVLLQLPPPQLSDVFSAAPDLRARLIAHVAGLSENQRAHIPSNLLEVIEGRIGSDQTSSQPFPSESSLTIQEP